MGYPQSHVLPVVGVENWSVPFELNGLEPRLVQDHFPYTEEDLRVFNQLGIQLTEEQLKRGRRFSDQYRLIAGDAGLGFDVMELPPVGSDCRKGLTLSDIDTCFIFANAKTNAEKTLRWDAHHILTSAGGQRGPYWFRRYRIYRSILSLDELEQAVKCALLAEGYSCEVHECEMSLIRRGSATSGHLGRAFQFSFGKTILFPESTPCTYLAVRSSNLLGRMASILGSISKSGFQCALEGSSYLQPVKI